MLLASMAERYCGSLSDASRFLIDLARLLLRQDRFPSSTAQRHRGGGPVFGHVWHRLFEALAHQHVRPGV
jgi:hypothetical protein